MLSLVTAGGHGPMAHNVATRLIRTYLRFFTSENSTLQVQFATTLLEHRVTMIAAKDSQIKQQLITNQHKNIIMM